MTEDTTSNVIHRDPEILGGTPVFVGTRVPLKNLIDYLESGHSLNDFPDDFPQCVVSRSLPFWRRPLEVLSQRAFAA